MESKYNEDIPRSQYYRREIVPTVVQMEMVECGAASLSMILGYFGKFIPLEELRVACGVSRDGASVLGILNAAQSYGLLAEGHMVNLEEVYEMPLPMIAYWEFKHFVVIEGFSREAVYINDPAVGPYAIPYDQFNRSFTGIVCVFEPTPNFVKSGKPVSTMAVIYELINKAKTPFFYALLAGLCLVIPGLAVPAFTQVFVDSILINHIYSWQGWFFFLMGVVAVVTILLKYLQLNILARLYVQLSTRISAEFLWKALRQSYVYYLLHHTGEIANRTQYLESVSRTVSSRLTGMVIDVIGAVVFAIAMFYYDPLIALFGIAIMAGDLYLMSYLYRSREDAYYYYQQTSIKAMSYSINSLKSMETLKATGMEYIYYSRWAGYYTKSLNALKEIGKKDIYSGVLPQFLKTLTLIMILSFGAWRVIDGHLTAGMLMALIMLMDNFTAPVTRLVGANQILQLLKINTARINDVLNSPMDKTLVQAEKDDKRLVGEEPVAKLKGGIELKNITYGYDRTIDPILKNVSLKINPGTYVGVVGSTGSGKSTLSKIISGLIYPWEGELLFDYKPRSELPRSLLVNSLSVVEQEANLFSGTVKDNISFFNPLIAQEVIIEAAKDACIHDMILSRRGGYELHLKANGSNLSGGERQRIELARALAKKPSILILDEATSALDTDVEASVMQNIRHRGVTCVIIAHRISTTRYCDEIIVLDKGEIVQRGTPDELLAQPGLYKELSDLEKNKQINVS